VPPLKTKGGSRLLSKIIGNTQLVPPRSSGISLGRIDPLSVVETQMKASSAEVSGGNLREWREVRGKRKSVRIIDSLSFRGLLVLLGLENLRHL